ncbi:hypothetical protein M378DRAFT_167193, partial [Amanita muscaria Koide BX008]
MRLASFFSDVSCRVYEGGHESVAARKAVKVNRVSNQISADIRLSFPTPFLWSINFSSLVFLPVASNLCQGGFFNHQPCPNEIGLPLSATHSSNISWRD